MAYKTRFFANLAHQLARSPHRLCLKHLHNIEFAMSVVAPDRRYPVDFLWQTITGVRPADTGQPQATIRGTDARADMLTLAEALSSAARLPASACPDRLSYPDELARRFRVSRKTISRWRHRGLTAWKVVGNDGRTRVAFPEPSVRRFARENLDMIRRAASFTQLTRADAAAIVARAREIVDNGAASRNAVIEQIAGEVRRARETVRQVLLRHDRENPDQPLFEDPSVTTGADWRHVRIWEMRRDGAEPAAIAEQFDLPLSEVQAVLTHMRARLIATTPIEFVDAECFRQADADRLIRECPAAESPFAPQSKPQRVPVDLPPFLQELYRRPLLTSEGEHALFRKMNYLKYRADVRRRALCAESATAAEVDQIEALLTEAAEIKNEIVCANLRLVVHIARRHLNPQRDLFELISDGNEVLMRAVDRFDFTRGFKFSTYCSWALIRRFARRSVEQRHRRAMFINGQEECLRDIATATEATDGLAARDMLDKVADILTDREWLVLRQRFGLLEDQRPRTLTEIGRELGISKERVRQIETESLARLRARFANRLDRLAG